MQTFIQSLIKSKEDIKKTTNPTPSESSINQSNSKIIKPKQRGKEVIENKKEEEKIKIFSNGSEGDDKFKLDFKVFGRSIFQNLILTVNAYVEENSELETIPVKCIWRRIKRDTQIYINDVNSNSYIPTAEDIGYTIEVEVKAVDTSIYGCEPIFGQYGPITIDEDIKSTIELLLSSGGTKFSCHIYDTKEQEKKMDKEIVVYINTSELKLVELEYTGKESILEVIKYHPSNPYIKLHPYDSTRFLIKFYEFEFNDRNQYVTNVEKLKPKLKSEYHLIAMSKQCRELIYLLMQFFLIDEKIKNFKLFNMVNYNHLEKETKVGITDLITEIKTLREENNIFVNNIIILERNNKDLKEEMKNLEEDFQITLESINNCGIDKDIENNKQIHFNNSNSSSFTANDNFTFNNVNNNNNFLNNSINYIELKKKHDELREQNSNLLSKEKGLREENRELQLSLEISKNSTTEMNHEIKNLKLEIVDKDSEINSLKKSVNIISDSKSKLFSTYEILLDENKNLNLKLEEKSSNKEKNSDENFVNLQNKIFELQKSNETLNYENKNLLLQRNLLTNQKEILAKEFEKIKKDSISHEDNYQNLMEVIKNKEEINLVLNQTVENYKKENNVIKNKYDILEIEYSTIKEQFDKMLISSVNANEIKISLEEYEEYDMLKKEKDEMDAYLMQLKSNNEAKDLEIINLKKMVENFKK